MLTPALWVGLGALVAMMVLRLGSGRRERRAAIGLALAGAVWVGEVAVMTNDGFSGNARYLIMPAAVACVLAGTGIGWLIRALPGALVRERARRRGALRRGRRSPSPRRASTASTPSARRSTTRRASPTASPGAIARAGGPDRLKACGTTYTGAFQVPSVAWLLSEHTTTVRSASAPGDAPPQVPARRAAVADDERQPPGSRRSRASAARRP